MKNPEQRPVETMSLEELCDALAAAAGWVLTHGGDETRAPFWFNENARPGHIPSKSARLDHPVPATLDAIAAAMPELWDWVNIEQYEAGLVMLWRAIATNRNNRHDRIHIDSCDTEILARARLAVACHRAAHEARKGNGGA